MTTNEAIIPDIDIKELRQAIRDEYAVVAAKPEQGFHFHTGYDLAIRLGYDPAWLQDVSEETVQSFAGTGNPFAIQRLQRGGRVVDIGSGAGLDSLIAAGQVGPKGQVVGVDMTPEMLAKARASAAKSGKTNVEFREGLAEALPVEDGWADAVISNGVLNLVPDKAAAFAEIYRVLKPGGRIQMGDILVQRKVSARSKSQVTLWTGCIAGAVLEEQLRATLEEAGFARIDIWSNGDVFEGAPQESSAASFGTIGINFTARKLA